MTNLHELQVFIEQSELEAREQDKVLGQFFDYIEELEPNAVLRFRRDVLPEAEPRQPIVRATLRTKPGAVLIRG